MKNNFWYVFFIIQFVTFFLGVFLIGNKEATCGMWLIIALDLVLLSTYYYYTNESLTTLQLMKSEITKYPDMFTGKCIIQADKYLLFSTSVIAEIEYLEYKIRNILILMFPFYVFKE